MIILNQSGIVTIETLELSIEAQYNTIKHIYEYGLVFNMGKKQGYTQGYILGVYDTEKRVQEVQREIILTYQLSEIFKYAKDQIVQAIILDLFNKNGLQPFIYKMPNY